MKQASDGSDTVAVDFIDACCHQTFGSTNLERRSLSVCTAFHYEIRSISYLPTIDSVSYIRTEQKK